ncbi:MAG TPA: DUF6499 domain-containing protein [Gammaproteobacteria bacterium]
MNALADWRSQLDYPAPGPATSLARWHWEFLRRNVGYQRDYEQFVSLSKQVPNQARQRSRLAASYGLDGIMFDYRDPLEILFASPRRANAVRMVRWDTRFVEDEQGNFIETDIEDLDYLSPRLRQHECCIVFNLREPVEVQIETAKMRLEKEYRRFASRRGRVDKYPLYLRLLDGEADGASVAELAEHFYPDVEARIGRRRIDAELEEAILLRDVNFRYI